MLPVLPITENVTE